MTDVEKILGNIAKKSGEDVTKLRAEYNTILETVAPGDKREEKALRELNKKYVADKSSAVSRNFIVIGIGDAIDYTAKRRQEALDMYKNNPDEALSLNMVQLSDSGNPIVLDTREFLDKNGKYKNKQFGKELLPSMARSCIILIEGEDGNFSRSSLSLRNKLATEGLPPMNTLVKARLNGDDKKGYSSSDKATQYEVIEVKSESQILDILAKCAGDNIQLLGDCETYHRSIQEGTPEYYNRFVITTGEVIFAKEGDEGKRNNFMVIDDISIDNTVSCFVPRHIELPNIGQTINVIAQTSIGKKWDPENKVATNEEILQLNVMGIISS